MAYLVVEIAAGWLTWLFASTVVLLPVWAAAWAGAGVICDAVSAQVLVLNLPLTGNAPAVRLCHAAPGEPVWLTLRSFRGDWELAGGAEVFVCENPTVLEAAADRHGAASWPLARSRTS